MGQEDGQAAVPGAKPWGAGSQQPPAQKPLPPLCLAKAVLQQQRKRGLAARAVGWDPLPVPQHWGPQGQMCRGAGLGDAWFFLSGCIWGMEGVGSWGCK